MSKIKAEVWQKIFGTNDKLRPDRILKFSLPALRTCPGAGECKKYCYADKGCYCFPIVKEAHLRNLELTKRDDFVENAIKQLRSKRSFRTIRIHDSGDFYNQEYLNKWIEIAKSYPEKYFYCYTKSFHLLDFSEFDALPNCKSIQSVGSRHDDKIDKSKPHAIIYNKNQDTPIGYTDVSESDLWASHKDITNIAIRMH